MQYFIKVAALIFLSSLPLPNQTHLKVLVKNVKIGKGNVFISAYNRDDLFLKQSVAEKNLLATSTDLEFEFDLPQGVYALSAYQDINNNKKLDFGIFHIPSEPTGFSNDFHPKFSAPQFKDAAINLNQPATAIVIELK